MTTPAVYADLQAALQELNTLFLDNMSGEISAQDARTIIGRGFATLYSRTSAAGLDTAASTALIKSLIEQGAFIANDGGRIPIDHLEEGILTEKELFDTFSDLPLSLIHI